MTRHVTRRRRQDVIDVRSTRGHLVYPKQWHTQPLDIASHRIASHRIASHRIASKYSKRRSRNGRRQDLVSWRKNLLAARDLSDARIRQRGSAIPAVSVMMARAEVAILG